MPRLLCWHHVFGTMSGMAHGVVGMTLSINIPINAAANIQFICKLTWMPLQIVQINMSFIVTVQINKSIFRYTFIPSISLSLSSDIK